MKIGDKIRERRKALGLTQAQAAEKYGCRRSVWADIEIDRRSPSLNRLERIARVLKCHVRDLL